MARSESQIVLALNSYRLGQVKSIRAAARKYKVSSNTLYRRSCGTLLINEIVYSNRKLTVPKETTLVNWILDMDTRGMLPTKALVTQIAKLLLLEQYILNASISKPTIGTNWVFRFI